MAGELPPQEAAPQEAPAEGGGAGGEIGQLVSGIANGMTTVSEIMAKSNAPPELMEQMQQVFEGFKAVIQGLSGGGEAPQEDQRAQAVPMQAPEGRPVGPAGV